MSEKGYKLTRLVGALWRRLVGRIHVNGFEPAGDIAVTWRVGLHFDWLIRWTGQVLGVGGLEIHRCSLRIATPPLGGVDTRRGPESAWAAEV